MVENEKDERIRAKYSYLVSAQKVVNGYIPSIL